MAARESAGKNFLVVTAVAVCCSALVSGTAVGLRARRLANFDLDRMRNIVAVAGLAEPNVPVPVAFGRVEPRTVDLETGAYVDDDRLGSEDPAPVPSDRDVAGIERRERYVQVYLVREQGRVSQIVLPVRGQGFVAMMYGFLALDRDLETVRGITFYRHEETPGLGALVDDPKWRASWRGKRIYGSDGTFRLRVGGTADPEDPEARAHQVDGVSGATFTSNGVADLVRFWFGDAGFGRYLARLRREGVDG